MKVRTGWFLLASLAFTLSVTIAAQPSEQAVKTTLQEPNRLIDWMVGKWMTKIRFWQSTDAPPVEGEGTAEHKLVLGGRYLLVSDQGTLQGQSFESMGFIGYDSETNKCVEILLDRTGTSPRLDERTCACVDKTCTVTGEFDDPKTGLHLAYRNVYKFEDPNHYTLETFLRPPESSEFKVMEISHTRSEPERPAESPAMKQAGPVPDQAAPVPKAPKAPEAPPAPSTESGSGRITGRVFRSDSNLGLAGVSVELTRGRDKLRATKSDAKGEFSIADIAPGPYGLVVTAKFLSQQELPCVPSGLLALTRQRFFVAVARTADGGIVEIVTTDDFEVPAGKTLRKDVDLKCN